MAAPKHRADASERIDSHVASLPDWSSKICVKLRRLLQCADPKMIEDWKWGPHYYLDGMVCGIITSKKYVSLVFFRGTQLKDKRQLLQGNPGNLNIKSFRFSDVAEIDEDTVLEYVLEAVDNNKKGIRPLQSKDKTVSVPTDILKAFKKAGVLKVFESQPYSHKKEYVNYIDDAKKNETRLRRIDKAISKLGSKL